MDIHHYPRLTRDEFAEACHYLDRQYCAATLGPLRKVWKLRLCTALDMLFALDGAYTTYIQIIRPLEEVGDPDDISAQLDAFSLSPAESRETEVLMADDAMIDAEESDQAAIIKQPPKPDIGFVTYEIHLHPTYGVPCLWFTLHGLPPDEPAFSIDTVFRRLVPDQFKASLRDNGPIGGISADHHPITGVPAFFVHPCLVGDALEGFQCSRENYLAIWMGLVGGCVGLWLPKEMAMS